MGLRPLACWDCGFEAHWKHGYVSVGRWMSGRGLYDGPIPLPQESYRVWCALSDLETPLMGRLRPEKGRYTTGEKIYTLFTRSHGSHVGVIYSISTMTTELGNCGKLIL